MIIIFSLDCTANPAKETILSIMKNQEAAWNKGDLIQSRNSLITVPPLLKFFDVF